MEKFVAYPNNDALNYGTKKEFDTLNEALNYAWELLEETGSDAYADVDIYARENDNSEYLGAVFWTEPEIMFNGE